jgi:CheY-like chemotaxis protein/anti-sigma regulatory factor (Ser/Thr protein kinase)
MKKEKDTLDKILKSAKRIASTVERLRTFYKIKIIDEELSEIDINKLINQSIEFTSHRWKDIAESTGSIIEIKKEFQSDLSLTQLDESELIEALTNVILNACDAMPNGGTLTFSTYRRENNIIIEIRDTGIGMDADTLEHCIDPFFTTKGNEGTGLGLAMVFGVMDHHKGEIKIDSEKNKGTTVKLIIPVYNSKKEKKIIDEIPPFTQTLKILSVEDDETISCMLKQMLVKKNHEVEVSLNGKLGLEIYKQELEKGKPFDVVITDLGMAEMDGISLSKLIKELTPDIPIILLTGWGALINKDEHSTIDYLLKKPITLEKLYKAINELFREKQIET